MSHRPHVAVIGAGIGGLASAVALAARGARVTVYERAATPGGIWTPATAMGDKHIARLQAHAGLSFKVED